MFPAPWVHGCLSGSIVVLALLSPCRDIPFLPGSPRRLSSRTVARGGQGPKQYLKVPSPRVPDERDSSSRNSSQVSRRECSRDSTAHFPATLAFLFREKSGNEKVINNYLDANEAPSEARLSRMHFHDNQRKVDYVLAYHYRKRGAHHGHGSPGHSLAVISNGETGKERRAGGPGDIELGPLDALEEERREQRDEFEHNLMAAGLELEKDLEICVEYYTAEPGKDALCYIGLSLRLWIEHHKFSPECRLWVVNVEIFPSICPSISLSVHPAIIIRKCTEAHQLTLHTSSHQPGCSSLYRK
ncbi:hypothetical protein STEG23_028550, partial [Scotinomys teguina]